MQGPLGTLDNDTKIDPRADADFLAESGKRLLEIERVVIRRPQTPNRAPALFNYPRHQWQNSDQHRLRRRILLDIVDSDMKLHGDAQEILQQRIVQFLGDTRTFREPFFETEVELARELMQAETINGQNRKHARHNAGKAEPPCLPKSRVDLESDGGFGAVPDAIGVARTH